MHRPQATSIATLCTLLLLLAACSGEEANQAPGMLESFQSDPIALERGRLLFQGSCASYCHGTEPRPGEDVDLFDCQWQHGGSNEDIFRIVTSGIPDTRMVGFGNNFPQGQNDLWRIIAYLRSQQECE